MTTATRSRRTVATPTEGVHRTPRHLYYFNGAGPWPGVTTVTDVLDKPALTKWKVEQVALTRSRTPSAWSTTATADGARPRSRTSRPATPRRATAGSRIHATIEHVLRGARTSPSTRATSPPSPASGRGSTSSKVRPVEVEAFLINETLGYGGTLDLVAEIAGETWLLDWKTSKSVAWPSGAVYDEMRLQLAAYAHAEFIAKPADPVRYPMPEIARFGIVHVTDGGTRLYEANVTDDDWIAFRACLRLHQWRNAGRAA
jgi:hypothetical protein